MIEPYRNILVGNIAIHVEPGVYIVVSILDSCHERIVVFHSGHDGKDSMGSLIPSIAAHTGEFGYILCILPWKELCQVHAVLRFQRKYEIPLIPLFCQKAVKQEINIGTILLDRFLSKPYRNITIL